MSIAERKRLPLPERLKDGRRRCVRCKELTYNREEIPNNAVHCMWCDHDGSRRKAALEQIPEVIML